MYSKCNSLNLTTDGLASGFQSMSISEVRSPRACRCKNAHSMKHSKVYGEFRKIACRKWRQKLADDRRGCGKTQLSHTMSVVCQVSEPRQNRMRYSRHAHLNGSCLRLAIRWSS